LIDLIDFILFYCCALAVADKKAACAAIAGSLKYRRLNGTLLECDLECCSSSYCNDGGKKDNFLVYKYYEVLFRFWGGGRGGIGHDSRQWDVHWEK